MELSTAQLCGVDTELDYYYPPPPHGSLCGDRNKLLGCVCVRPYGHVGMHEAAMLWGGTPGPSWTNTRDQRYTGEYTFTRRGE